MDNKTTRGILRVVAGAGEEPLQQLGVGQAAQRAEGVERPHVAQDAAGRSRVHPDSPPRFAVRPSLKIVGDIGRRVQEPGRIATEGLGRQECPLWARPPGIS